MSDKCYKQVKRLPIILLLLLPGCVSNAITDPTERGLQAVASAIVISAVIKAVFNK